MSVPCKFERSILSHDEYETIHLTHHPSIYEVEPAELEAVRSRLRKMRDKEHTLRRQKRREARGKSRGRGASFPGTAERPSQRKQVFAAALKRVNKELERLHNLAARTVGFFNIDKATNSAAFRSAPLQQSQHRMSASGEAPEHRRVYRVYQVSTNQSGKAFTPPIIRASSICS